MMGFENTAEEALLEAMSGTNSSSIPRCQSIPYSVDLDALLFDESVIDINNRSCNSTIHRNHSSSDAAPDTLGPRGELTGYVALLIQTLYEDILLCSNPHSP